ncbi:hypothetical protein K1T71_000047 [Dendrolimus kikuchii]|uniref:Uncharacterized protein n=1 Tax=Dendrolimus kikuchii TaxID=765133 RepID=A0ACC1DIS5_9NEOP|nr:hypothetical protein K1T71_000047 [Dendrolimus kikuchii]
MLSATLLAFGYNTNKLRMICYGINPSKISVIHSFNSTIGSTWRNKHQITYKPYVQPCYKDHDHKNMSLNRPMSPHVTIYAPSMPSTTSIVQRISGAILTFYALCLSGGTLFLSNGIETYVSIIQSLDLSRFSILLIKFTFGAPFTFHYFNAYRYTLWNMGKMLKMKDVYSTSYKAIIAAAVLNVLFALL